MSNGWDVVVVGSGPNGLAAAITIARAGASVLVLEAATEAGGGLRSGELTLPGFSHDICASVLPLAAASPFFRQLPLAEHGLEWVVPELALAHPFDAEPAATLGRSLPDSSASLGVDEGRYRRLMEGLVTGQEELFDQFLGPLRLPRRPLGAARFALKALLPATALSSLLFRGAGARALFAGLAAHSTLPLERPGTASFALVLAMLAHTTGWPFVRGGSVALASALVSYLESLGGLIDVASPVRSLADLPPARAVLFDVTPRQLLTIAGEEFSAGYRRQLQRFRYGPGVCKVDFALSGPIPWRDEACRRAGTVHLGGGAQDIRVGERAPWQGMVAERPFVILAQPTLFDSSRAPAGRHTAWAYCHVPHGSDLDASRQIEAQVERFAPGFRELVLARSVRTARQLESYNPNYVGGDINGGVQDLGQMFTRPTLSLRPYRTSDPRLFICSSSTPPGGGVHGLCGYHAANAVLKGLDERAS